VGQVIAGRAAAKEKSIEDERGDVERPVEHDGRRRVAVREGPRHLGELRALGARHEVEVVGEQAHAERRGPAECGQGGQPQQRRRTGVFGGAYNGRGVKLLHVAPFYEPAWAYGGMARAASALARAQAARGDDVTVVTARWDAAHAAEDRLGGVRV